MNFIKLKKKLIKSFKKFYRKISPLEFNFLNIQIHAQKKATKKASGSFSLKQDLFNKMKYFSDTSYCIISA